MLRSVIFVVRDAHATSSFFQKAVGLVVRAQSDSMIELSTSLNPTPSCPKIIIKEASSAAQLSSGYSPMLSFDVPDLDKSVSAALEAGALLDGPIKYTSFGRMSALRSADGHMIGLFQADDS